MRSCDNRVRWRTSLGFRSTVTVLALIMAVTFSESQAQAWYGHRNYRSSRYGRMNNRLAGVQRASSAAGMAQARLYSARVNAARQMRQAHYQAQHSPAITSAKAAERSANHDYQAARDNVVNQLKANNPEFRDLLAQCDAKRQQIAALAKTGGSTAALSAELQTMARKVSTIQDRAISADPTVQSFADRKQTAHSSLQSAENDAKAAVAQDPGVRAAQQQLAQASQQAQQAAARYNNALMGANSGGMYGRGYHRRRSGYVVNVYAPRHYGSYHAPHFAAYHPAHSTSHPVHRSVQHAVLRHR